MIFDIKYLQDRSLPDPVTGCWNWAKGKTTAGYGVLRLGGKPIYAHRLALGLHLGVEPRTIRVARHGCDNPACVNPAHLQEGTVKDNVRDAKKRGRLAVGSRHGQSKLSEDDVREIRYRCRIGEDRVAICALFGVNNSVVSEITTGKAWSHA